MTQGYAAWAAVSTAAWTNATLAGRVDPDTAAGAICASGGDVPQFQRVAGLPGFDDPVTLPVALNVLRRSGATHATVALPVPGDPLGLGGPVGFNADATSAGQAVLVPDARLGLVPTTTGASLVWWMQQAMPRPVPDLGEADRSLRAMIVRVADDLANTPTGLAPDLVDVLLEDHAADRLELPDAYPARTRGVLDRAIRIAWATDLGRTGEDPDTRRIQLAALNAAARTAIVAAVGVRLG